MRNPKDLFTAQQLTKKQMNNVKGGRGIADGYPCMAECAYTDNNGIHRKVWGFGNDFLAIRQDLVRQVGTDYTLNRIGTDC